MEHSIVAPVQMGAPWETWRDKAFEAHLAAAGIIALPFAIAFVALDQPLSRNWQVCGAALYVLLLALAALRGWHTQLRIWVMVLLVYAVAIVAMANRGLLGFGRIGLTVYPFWILVLFGPKAGWAAFGVSLGIYGAFTAMAGLGFFEDSQAAIGADPGMLGLWVVQGLALILGMSPGLVLLGRFQSYQMRTLSAEQRLSAQLQSQIAQCTSASKALERELIERQRLESRIAQIGEEERRRLGHEVHDGLCQQLTAALLNCTALEDRLAAHSGTDAACAGKLRTLLGDTLKSAYEISRGICPVGPDPDSLVPALESLARRTSTELGLPCGFSYQGDLGVVGPQCSMHLYRIAEEAVTNAVKHSSGKRVSIALEAGRDEIVLRVADDGRGVSASSNPGGGMGLSIMDYRTRCLGGSLNIARANSGGVMVVCRVPRKGDGSSKGGVDGHTRTKAGAGADRG